jgi:Flp pilus assembly protein TadD
MMLRSLLRELTGGRQAARQPAVSEPLQEPALPAVRAAIASGLDAIETTRAALTGRASEQLEGLLLDGYLALLAKGDPRGARDVFARAVALKPRLADGYAGLAEASYQLGEHETAYTQAKMAFQLRADATSHYAVGLAALGLRNQLEAESSLRRAVELMPRHGRAWNALGVAFQRAGRVDDARHAFETAVDVWPGNGWAHSNLGLTLWDQGRLEGAIEHLRRASELYPENSSIVVNLALVLKSAGALEEAQGLLAEASKRFGQRANILLAQSNVAREFGDTATAESHCRAAIAMDPESAEARAALGEILVGRGEFTTGWREYEYRHRIAGAPGSPFPWPQWDGGSLAGRTIVIYDEQGIGDIVLFASCLSDAIEEAERCILVCSPRLHGLFARSFPRAIMPPVDSLRSTQSTMEAVQGYAPDCCAPIGNLMARFRSERAAYAAGSAYLTTDPVRRAHWRSQLSPDEGPIVGIAWRGGSPKTGDRAREIRREDVERLFDVPGCRFVILQHFPTREDRAWLDRVAATRANVRLESDQTCIDLDELASLVSTLDMVVSACCTLVHVSGAVGVPTLALAPVGVSWRYQFSGGAVPWYPSVEVARQSAVDDWSVPVARAVERLGALTGR